MELSKSTDQNYTVVNISGRLDTTNYQDLEKALQEIVDGGVKNIIIDASGMNYISSSGLRIFLMFLKKINVLGGRFVISGMQEGIHEIFKISGFTSIFEIYTDTETAKASFH